MSGKLLSPFLVALFSVVTGWLCDLTFLITSERTLVVLELKARPMTDVLDSLTNIELTVRLAKLRDSILQVLCLPASLQALLQTEVVDRNFERRCECDNHTLWKLSSVLSLLSNHDEDLHPA